MAGRAFHSTANDPEGPAGKRLSIASARGGIYSGQQNDFQEHYLRQAFGLLDIQGTSCSCALEAWRIRYSIAAMRDALR